jgi:hypothetical protein
MSGDYLVLVQSTPLAKSSFTYSFRCHSRKAADEALSFLEDDASVCWVVHDPEPRHGGLGYGGTT